MISGPRLVGAAAILAALVGFKAGTDWQRGVAARAALDRVKSELTAAQSRAARETQAQIAEATRRAAALALEDAAREDPAHDGCGLPVERVRRLNRF